MGSVEDRSSQRDQEKEQRITENGWLPSTVNGSSEAIRHGQTGFIAIQERRMIWQILFFKEPTTFSMNAER
jgi:hypothetical protein